MTSDAEDKGTSTMKYAFGMRGRDVAGWLVVAAASVVFFALSTRWLSFYAWGIDEGMYLMRARMMADGYALYRDIWFNQPPLLVLAVRKSFDIHGESVQAARLVPLLLATLGLASTAAIARALGGWRAAFASAVLLVLSPLYFSLSRAVMATLPALSLAMVSMASIVGYRWATLAGRGGRRTRVVAWAFAALSGLAFGLGLTIKLIALPWLLPLALVALDGHVDAARWRAPRSWPWRRIAADALLWAVAMAVPVVLVLRAYGPAALFAQAVGSLVTAREASGFDIAGNVAKLLEAVGEGQLGVVALGVFGVAVGLAGGIGGGPHPPTPSPKFGGGGGRVAGDGGGGDERGGDGRGGGESQDDECGGDDPRGDDSRDDDARGRDPWDDEYRAARAKHAGHASPLHRPCGPVGLWRIVALWLAVGLAAVLLHAPIWSHHYILLVYPLAAAAGCGLVAVVDAARDSSAAGWRAFAWCVAGAAILSLPVQAVRLADSRRAWDDAAGEAIARLGEVARPGDYVVTDSPMIAFRAGLRVPPDMCDPGKKRIDSGALTVDDVIADIDRFQPSAVLFWEGRLSRGPFGDFPARLEAAGYVRVAVLDAREERWLYVPQGRAVRP